MACDRFVESLKAHAQGGPLHESAAAHLAVCSRCQAMFDREARVLAMIDDVLGDVTASAPAADFQPRLRERLERRASRSARAWWWWLSAGGLVAVSLIVAVLNRSPSRDQVAIPRVPVAQPIEPPAEPPAHAAAGKATASKRPASPPWSARSRETLGRHPEVFVPAGQRQQVGRLFASLRAGRPEVVSMLMNMQVQTSPEEDGTSAITVAPIRIEPVVVRSLPVAAPIIED